MPEAKRLILASASPRRRRLLEMIGIPHVVEPARIDEIPEPGEEPQAFALRAATDKAREVARRRPRDPVLAADTVVELDGKILGKPTGPEDAAAMLRRLSGRIHHVHTSLALALGPVETALLDTASVHFKRLTQEQISWYVSSGEPLDKAGAYAVQGRGGLFVRSVEGSPHTVVGLPLHRLEELFAAAGLDLWSWISDGALSRRT